MEGMEKVLLSSLKMCLKQKNKIEMEISLSGIETSLNEISHVFIRGEGKGFGKDLYGGEWLEGIYLERGNTILHFLVGRILSRVKHLVDFVWETFQGKRYVSLFLSFLPSSYSIFLLE